MAPDVKTMPHPTRARRGFTLLELMISIALVLLLVLGINQVFSLSSRTVGAGQAMSGIARDARSAQSVIYNDARVAVIDDGPCFFIRSERQWAWRNAQDQQQDQDGKVDSFDLDRNNSETDSIDQIPTTTYNHRNHRLDRMGFFARDLFRRQTGNEGQFAADMTSNEAYVWYGHLKRASNSVDTSTGTYDLRQ